MNEKIGVIVPVYKTEKYVAECIESILAQTYTNFRLILVDDGSPDNAGKICDEYAEKDSRITLIHQENAGVTRARAAGVEAAEDCEWITFVDSDDTITEDALQLLHNMIDTETGIVISFVDNIYAPQSRVIKFEEYINMLLHDCSMNVALWGKLFRKSIFSKRTFAIPREIKSSEDIVTNLHLAFNCERNIVYTKSRIYNYRENTESVSHTFIRDIEYEQILHEEKIKAIPIALRKQFLKGTIPLRLSKWRIRWGWEYSCGNMKETFFYKSLSNDIKSTGYKLNFWDKVLFHNTNKHIRFAAIIGRKMSNHITKLYELCKKQ